MKVLEASAGLRTLARGLGQVPYAPQPRGTARTEKPRAEEGMRGECSVRLSDHGSFFWQRCEAKASSPQSITSLFSCQCRNEQSITALPHDTAAVPMPGIWQGGLFPDRPLAEVHFAPPGVYSP